MNLIFGTIKNDSDAAGVSLTLFHKKISDIIKDYKSISSDKIGVRKLKSGFSGVLQSDKISDDDIKAIEQYNSLILKNVDASVAYDKALGGASEATKTLVKNSKTATIDINALTQAESAATLATKALSVALNMAFTLGISLVIQSIISGFSKLINAEAEAKQQAEENRQAAVESIESYKDEIESLQDVRSKYIKLATTTSDLVKQKESLTELQDEVIKNFSTQKEQIDLLNESLTENIRLMDEEEYRSAKKQQEDLKSQYDEAQKYLEQGVLRLKINPKSIKNSDLQELYDYLYSISDNGVTWGGKDNYGVMQLYNIEEYMRTGIMPSYKEQLETLDKIIERYGNLENYNKEVYNLLTQQRTALQEEYKQYEEITSTYKSLDKYIKDYEAINSEAAKQIDSIVQNAQELYKTSIDGTATEQYVAIENIQKLKEEALELAADDSVLQARINDVFDAFSSGAKQAGTDLESLNSAFYKTLDEMQQGAFANIGKMKSALQTLVNGDGLSSDDFWGLIELDTDKIITDIQMIGDKYYLTEEQLVSLKDNYIQKQAESIQAQITEYEQIRRNLQEQLKLEEAMLEVQIATGVNSAADEKILEEKKAKIQAIRNSMADYGAEINRDTLLLNQLNASLGNTVDYTESLQKKQKELNDELTALNKELDDYQKAYNYIIDSRIEEEEKELAILETQKQALQDELDILNEQKAVIEETIKNYETVNSLVQNTVQKEIDSLNEQKKAIEDTYNKRIEALKEENEQRENALEYAQKLANLENAKNNKVRVIDSTRGFRYESIKEDVVSAQNDLSSFENNQAIKQLEKERDTETAVFDNIIKDKEQYAKFWKSISEEVQTEEEEILATEILGAEWREKIAAGDIEIMEKFKTEYRSHNSALKTLTNSEIKLKEAAIKAKDAEIEAKNKQINKWKEFKNEVSKAVDNIKAKNSDYYDLVKKLEREEPLTLANRQQAFDTFSKNVSDYIGRITAKQNEINNTTSAIENVGSAIEGLTGKTVGIDVQVYGLDELQRAKDEAARLALAGALEGYNVSNMAEVVTVLRTNQVTQELTDKAIEHLSRVGDMFKGWGSFSTGGVDDYTGTAMLHGRKNAPEVIFNASDAKKLYEYVHGTPNLVADAVSEISKTTGFKLSNNTNNNTNNSSVSIGAINVYANNPQELTKGLDKQLDQYFRTKLTQGYTSKN